MKMQAEAHGSAFFMRLPLRIRASCVHLLVSIGVSLLAAVLVYGVWYPYPYSELSGGRELFLIVVSVDVIVGPMITLVLFNPSKSISILRNDMIFVALLQTSALTYGLWTVGLARPVHLVFEIDRFRVVSAIDVPADMVHAISSNIEPFPWNGPSLLGVREFKDVSEKFEATVAAIQGVQLSFRPDYWQSYSQSVPRVLKVAFPSKDLIERLPNHALTIRQALNKSHLSIDSIVCLPLIGRKEIWTICLNSMTAQVVAYIPVDPF